MKHPRQSRRGRLNHDPKSVKWAREKCGLNKRQLASMCGFSEQLMGDIEAGRRNATPKKLAKIAEVLNCPIVLLESKNEYLDAA